MNLKLPILILATFCAALSAQPTNRNAWYWDSIVNLHIDNHSSLVGQGHTPAELAAMIRDIPVDMVEVSAYGAVGDSVTYPTKRLPELLSKKLDGFDTLGAWREAVTSCGKRFHVYLNTRGLNLYKKHPDWMQRNAAGKGRGRGDDQFDACARPAPNGDGYLEKILLPLLQEVSQQYQPGGFWVDGDHARTIACYCPNCREAWRRQTGQANPPADASSPQWSAWLRFEQDRYDDYRRQMADAVHQSNPRAVYTSNHSWRKTFSPTFEKDDPRDPPAFIDTLSADLSHGNSLRETRLSAMSLSPDTDTPHDIMHLINQDRLSLGRVLQQGSLTLSFGGPWFLWVSGSTITKPEVQQRAKACAQFARDRALACGRSTSCNPYAVLVSETAWLQERTGSAPAGFWDYATANDFALALQDAACGVDLLNESLFQKHAANYRCVVIPNQRALAPKTVALLESLVEKGGTVLLTGGALRPEQNEDARTAQWLSLTRSHRQKGQSELNLHRQRVDFGPAWDAQLASARVLAAFADGRPALTETAHGQGRVLWLNIDLLPYPESDGLIPWVMERSGFGPSFRIDAPSADSPHLVFATRNQGAQKIIHLADLTTRVAGKRVVPDSADVIDPATPIDELRLSVAMSRPPSAVQIVPATTTVSHSWKDGVLSLVLKHFEIHAALVMDGAPAGPAELLPANTALASRFAWSQYPDASVIQLDFETESQGHVLEPFAGCTLRESGPLRIVPTTETASKGKSSAKFIDGPDAAAYFPYLIVQPKKLTSGTAQFSVDLRLGANAQPSIEFRTVENRRENPVGPSLRVAPDGTLRTEQGQKLLALPHDQWFQIAITCALGSGTYDARVTIPGQAPQEFRNLPCVSGAQFTRCSWIGINSMAREKTIFYADNLNVQRASSKLAQ